jgi:hypothetical protein
MKSSTTRQGLSTTTLSHLSTSPSSGSPTSAEAAQQPLIPISPKINTADKDLKASCSKSTPGHRASTQLKSGQLMRFKAYSVAFVITLDSQSDGSRLAKGFEISKLHVWSESSPAETAQERAVQLRMQQQSVAHRRELIQSDRVLRLQRANQNKRYKTLIHQHRDRLETLKLEAKLEYALTAASVRRHLIQRRRIERLNARIEHAQ